MIGTALARDMYDDTMPPRLARPATTSHLAGCLVLAESRRRGSQPAGSTVLGERTGASDAGVAGAILAQR